MPFSEQNNDIKELSSEERLRHAMIDMWHEAGQSGVSVRALARKAEIPTSAIYNNFGSLDQLFLSSQASAKDEAERWCERQIDSLRESPGLSPEAFPAMFATLIDEWAQGQRRLAFAYCECVLLTMRDPAYAAALNPWRDLWSRFWGELCGRVGLGAFGEATAHMFDGQSQLHMMRWRRLVDRAALDELCRGWGSWLSGSLAEEGPWRRFAREEAFRTEPVLPEGQGVIQQISALAADIVEQDGVAGLTHRAVAARGGLSLGIVTYNAGTSADLVQIAYNAIYRRIVSGGSTASDPAGGDGLRASVNVQALPPIFLAMEELILAVARHSGAHPFTAQLRYLRGRSSGATLQSFLGEGAPISPLDAALYSSFISGQRRALIGRTEEAMDATVRTITYPLIEGLRASSHPVDAASGK